MHQSHAYFSTLKPVGGASCLDFVNTASARDTGTPNERLHSYADLLAWATRVEVLGDADAHALLAQAVAHPDDAEVVLRRAKELREALFHLFDAVIHETAPAPAALDVLNAHVATSYPHLRLVMDKAGFSWSWESSLRLDSVLWPVVRSAAEVLLSAELDRVRICEGEHCGWLFVDRSKNRSRRWCDMQECGNVAKVRRYRRRHKDAHPEPRLLEEQSPEVTR